MERSDDRLSTRDIASPSGGPDTATDTDRDAALADAPPADTAAVPPERADREYDDGGDAGAISAERAGEGDVVTDEPSAGRGPSRESIVADPGAGDTADGGADDRPAPAAAAAAAAGTGEGTATGDTGTSGGDGATGGRDAWLS